MADPATLTAISSIALGSAAGQLTSLATSKGAATPPGPTPPPAPALPVQQPQGQKAGGAATAQSPQASFVGASSLPQQSGYGQKSLLGT